MSAPTQPRAAVVMPVGPGTVLEHLQDSLDSIDHWMPGTTVVAIDDSGDPALSAGARYPGIVWLSSGKTGAGTGDGVLHLVLCQGYRHVADHTDADVMIKMDTDAVITGPSPDRDAAERFRAQPGTGLLGSFRTTCTGGTRDFSPAARAIADETRLLRRHPRPAGRAVRTLLRRARSHGYEMGEHVLGGTSFVSRACLDALRREGLLDLQVLERAHVVEDHLLSLSIRAVGFEHGDFAVGTDPLAVAWRGLPIPAEEVVAMGKKVAHSVSDWGDQREVEVRRVFREHREGAAAAVRAEHPS